MSFLTDLLGGKRRERDPVRPLWHRTVEIAREPHWYAQGGIADTVSGRFDAITLVLALVTLRMEREEALRGPSALLTELFVEDMDGQLRETGVGDPSVGKHISKLMQVLGGRMGALRGALGDGETALVPVLERNMTLVDGADVSQLAASTQALWQALLDTSADNLLAARIAR